MLYLWLKTIHIVLAIVAVGFSASYGLIIGRARRAGRTELTFALKTVRAMGDYVANPAFVLLFVTGYGLIHMSGLPIGTRWVHVSMALLLVAMGLGFGIAGPRRLRSGCQTTPEWWQELLAPGPGTVAVFTSRIRRLVDDAAGAAVPP